MGERTPPQGEYSSGLMYGTLGFATTGVLTVVTSVATAWLFGVRVIGEFALATAPATALFFLSSVREQVALVRELSGLPRRAPAVTGLWLAVFTFSAAFTLAVSIVAAAITYWAFNGPVDQPDLFVPALVSLAGNVLVQNVSSNLDSVFSAFVAGRDLFVFRVLDAVLWLTASVVAGIVMPTVWGLVLALYLSSVPSLIARALFVRRYMRWRVPLGDVADGFRRLPRILGFAIRMAPGGIFTGASNQSPTWVLGALGTVPAVGAFSRAQMLAGRFQELSRVVVQMLYPTLVARRNSGDGAGFDRAYVETMRYSTGMTLAMPAIAGGAAPAIMAIFGSGFTRASDALMILLLTVPLSIAAQVQSFALYAVDRPGLVSMVQIGRFVVTIAVAVPATMLLGIEGPGIGLVAGLLSLVAVNGHLLRPHHTVPVRAFWSRRQMLGGFLAAVLAFGAGRLAGTAVPGVAGLPIAFAAGTVVYVGAYLALAGLNAEDRRRLGALRARASVRLHRAAKAASSA